MRSLGRSGARITLDHSGLIRKTGGSADLREQAKLCETLGTSVCPVIYDVGDDWYVMEHLFDDPEAEVLDVMTRVASLLKNHVWSRSVESSDWRGHLTEWVEAHAPWIRISSSERFSDAPCRTHGDPTRSNTMFRPDGSLCLIDPLPRRPYVASARAVDVGKMLQSLIGWENVLIGQKPQMHNIEKFSEECGVEPVESFFWLSVHLARAMRYVGDPVRSWCRDESSRYAARI